MDFAFGEPIVVITRTKTGTDALGDDVFTESTMTRPGGYGPAVGSELTDGRDQVSLQPQALFSGQDAVDVAAVLTAQSVLEIRGKRYEVVGDPADWLSPLTGWHPGLQVPLKKVTG